MTKSSPPVNQIDLTVEPNSIHFDSSRSKLLGVDQISRTLKFSPSNDELYNDSVKIASIIEEIKIILDESKASLLSLDVFDTTLLRSTKCEARRFFEISQLFCSNINASFTPYDAFIARLNAAKASYRYANSASDLTREGKHSTIVEITCSLLGVRDLADQYLSTEIQYEISELRLNPIIKGLTESLNEQAIVFISDMYFSSETIRQLLSPYFSDPEVYSSGDGLGSKRAGGLFTYVANKKNIPLDKVLHIGDSLKSDFQPIRRLGGRSLFFPLSNCEINQRRQCYERLSADLNDHGISLESVVDFNY